MSVDWLQSLERNNRASVGKFEFGRFMFGDDELERVRLYQLMLRDWIKRDSFDKFFAPEALRMVDTVLKINPQKRDLG